MIKLTIPIEPVEQERPKASRTRNGVHLYDHTDISDVEWNTDNERSLVMYGENYIVPTDNVAYVESIPDKEE